MVTPVGGRPKRIILKANRETLVLVASACTVTLALAYSIRNRPPELQAPPAVEASQPQPQGWAGDLADVSAAPTATVSSAEPLSSASLVVPKSALALPVLQTRKKACEPGAPCVGKTAASVRSVVAKSEVPRPAPAHEKSLMSRLNPLNHLPDVDLGRPFTYAGDTISGWIRRF